MSEIDEHALNWVVKQASGSFDAEEQRAFEAWYDSNTRNQGAYLRAQAIWHSLDKTTIQQNLRPSVPGAIAGPPIRGVVKPTRRRLLIGGGSAAIAAGLAGAVVFSKLTSNTMLSTATGEIRKVPLADRTMASLNSGTQMQVRMTPRLRRVVLVEGEALFEVAKNPERPFVVEAGDIRVRAVGTAFSVRRHDLGADVFVTEGVVETWSDRGSAGRQRLSAGQVAFVPNDAGTIRVSTAPGQIERRLAWRDGKVILENETLSQAVDEFNRYNTVKLVIGDPEIRNRRFVGQFRLDQPEDFANTVQSLLGVPVSKHQGEIILGDKARGA